MQGVRKRLITEFATVVLLIVAVVAWVAPAAGAAAFSDPTTFGVGPSPQSVAVGEFNGDADPDLAVVNQLSNNVSVLLGAAGGAFTGPTDFAVGITPLEVAVGEFNGDADPDLAVVNEASSTVSVLLGAAGGSSPARPISPSGPRPNRSRWASSTATRMPISRS